MTTERITIELKYPIQFGSKTISEFALRRMKAGDLHGIPAGASEEEKTLHLIGRLAGQPEPVVDELDAVDMIEISKVIESFF